jgi:2,3-bisphosphoglycerate-independent phosphoglycerate mutase
MSHKTFVLLILDGFGIDTDHEFNAITHAKMPSWDALWAEFPHALLDASGMAVGLPPGQIGNSEVGHMTIGAGRLLYQDLTRIDQAIRDGTFAQNPVLQKAGRMAKDAPIHLIGLLSDGGVHSHENHFFAAIKAFSEMGCNNIFIHAFLDGRDVAPKSAKKSLEKIIQFCADYPQAKVASICGRYYAMDRDQRWDRIQRAYEALTEAKTHYQANDSLAALAMAYARGETDEFVQPTWIDAADPIQDGDGIFFINFRSDRARELSRAFLQTDFSEFKRGRVPQLAYFLSMTEYAKDIPTQIVFPSQNLRNGLGEYLAKLDKTQLRLTETEKYAHVTFFFNGGQEQAFPGEERILVPSPRIDTYDLQPAMSAVAVTEQLINAIDQDRFDVIICNFANPDMVGHTGDFAATVAALEVIDQCLHDVWQALKKKGGELLITADHGNADCMFDKKNNQPHTAHTTALVPLLYVGRPAQVIKQQGVLSDIAPTLLAVMGLVQPDEMTGSIVFQLKEVG